MMQVPNIYASYVIGHSKVKSAPHFLYKYLNNALLHSVIVHEYPATNSDNDLIHFMISCGDQLPVHCCSIYQNLIKIYQLHLLDVANWLQQVESKFKPKYFAACQWRLALVPLRGRRRRRRMRGRRKTTSTNLKRPWLYHHWPNNYATAYCILVSHVMTDCLDTVCMALETFRFWDVK